MTEWHMESDIIMLLKTLKKEYLDSTLDGKLCFSCPSLFTSTINNLKPGQQDTWDSHLSFDAHHVVIAPIISKEDEPLQYGPAKKVADKTRMHTCNSIVQRSPMTCFRKVTMADLQEQKECDVFALGDLVDRISSEMGHDAYVLIAYPLEFLKQLNEKERFFGHSIHYGEIDEQFESFLEEYPLQQGEMFQKSMNYAWQQEYRLVLTPRDNSNQVFVEMGSIRDIAIGGDLEDLRHGIAFWSRNQNNLAE